MPSAPTLASPNTLSSERPYRWAAVGLGAAFVFVLAAVLALAALDASALYAIPLLPVGAYVWLRVARHRLAYYWALMAFFGVQSGFSVGVSPLEVAFGLFYALYLAQWFYERVYARGERVLVTSTDKVLFAFLLYLLVAAGLGAFFGAEPMALASDLANFSTLALYFPTKEIVQRERHGAWHVLAILLLLGVLCSAFNCSEYSEKVSNASFAWQVARGRVTSNEMLLLIGSLVGLGLSVLVRNTLVRAASLVAFAIALAGLLLTQFRAYYVDFALGVLVISVLVRGRQKAALVGLLISGTVVLGALMFYVVGDALLLMAYGLVDRVLSIRTAGEMDISVLNRLLETRRVIELIVENPVVGYGLGVEFGFYDAIYDRTWVKTFVHNGYLMLWYKFGIIGLGMILWLWLSTIRMGWRACRSTLKDPSRRAAVLLGTAVLISLLPSHVTSAAFSTMDTLVAFGTLLGLVAGAARPQAVAERA